MGTGVSAVGVKIHITGIVQGVGFRPFIYRLAHRYQLRGTVLNNSQGVFITAWGAQIPEFIAAIYEELPAASSISSLVQKEFTGMPPEDFTIVNSEAAGEKGVFVAPDLKICADCLRELQDKTNFRYGYPFINCTNCGPRYSIIKDIPYDRPFTSMGDFPMCEDCAKEYINPLDRRFHAQPNACTKCGPHYTLVNGKTGVELVGDPIAKAKELLAKGAIVAVKGIGGFHLACDAYNEAAVSKLRQRKGREAKALAVMVATEAKAKELGIFSPAGEEVLNSVAAPIVLVNKQKDYPLAEGVAPHNPKIGIMLAYAPIHYLLLGAEDVLVMTSANLSHEPMIYKNDKALKDLQNLADYILLHNREIINPVDDSVVLADEEIQVLRRGRGYAPVPVALPTGLPEEILALGGELKATFAINKGDNCFLAPHLGDLENQGTYLLYKSTINLYKNLFQMEPTTVVGDLHPEYFSTKYGKSLNLPMMQVQHHHAHIASVLAEHNLQQQVLGIALDGTGYGADGNLWGGEFILADLKDYTRVGHFAYLKLPGGSKAIKEPWRMATYVAYQLWGQQYKEILPDLVQPNGDLVIQAAEIGLNSPLTSSAGRIFDVAAAMLGICYKISYEGQAAIELERYAQVLNGEIIEVNFGEEQGVMTVDFAPMFKALPELKLQHGIGYAAYSVHLSVAKAIGTMIEKLVERHGKRALAFSGGVCQNRILMRLLQANLQDYRLYFNKVLPPNDGGLAYGQLAIARARLGAG